MAPHAAVGVSVTFADAAAEYLRFAEQDRGCKHLTVRGYRNAIKVHLPPVVGEIRLEEITEHVRMRNRCRNTLSPRRAVRPLIDELKGRRAARRVVKSIATSVRSVS